MTEDTSSMKELGSSGPAGLTCSASSLTRQRGVRHLRQADRGGIGLQSGSKAPAQISNLPISLWGGMGRDVGCGFRDRDTCGCGAGLPQIWLQLDQVVLRKIFQGSRVRERRLLHRHCWELSEQE